MADLSLAQWTAERGGIAMSSQVRSRDVSRLRELNVNLRGRHALVRRNGHGYDDLARWAELEGYPVTEQNYLELLERDAVALVEKQTTRGHVYAATWQGDVDFTYPEDEPAPSLEMPHYHACCPVCGVPNDGETCQEDLLWAAEKIIELQMLASARRFARERKRRHVA